MFCSICAFSASVPFGSRRALAPVNHFAGSRLSVTLLVALGPTVNGPSRSCSSLRAEVKVKSLPSILPSTTTDLPLRSAKRASAAASASESLWISNSIFR